MGYIDDNLMNNEKVVLKGVLHRAPLFLQALIAIVAVFATGVLLLLAVTDAFRLAVVFWIATVLGVLFSIGGVVGLLQLVLYFLTAEFAVSDRRILVKTGWIRRHIAEFPLRQVESLSFEQTLFDRIIRGAKVRINGSGSSWITTALLANFLEFRNAAAEQIERVRGGAAAAGGELGTVSAD